MVLHSDNPPLSASDFDPPEALTGPVVSGGAVGRLVRRHRARLGLTLQQLAERAGCAKSYVWAIENDVRAGATSGSAEGAGGAGGARPSDVMLGRLERSLGLREGTLVEASRWQQTPVAIRKEVAELHNARRAAHRLAEAIREAGPRGLDELYKSGILPRLVGQVTPSASRPASPSVVPIPLPVEIPLINSVAAGYPRQFTDLGYPARVADQYIRSPDICDPDAFAARVVGDSMEPLYREGDIVIFSPSRTVVSGMDCFIRLERDEETTFKRVYFEEEDEGAGEGGARIRLQPLNAAYPPRIVPREDVAGLYAAVSVTRSIA